MPIDQFAVLRRDGLLCAALSGSFALCFSDDVQDAGALLHMRAGRPGRQTDPELTDNTLSTDLLLLERCMAALREAEPRGRHWQARFVAHADPAAGGRERLEGIRAFLEICLADSGVSLASVAVHDAPCQVRFRPSLRQLRCDGASPRHPGAG